VSQKRARGSFRPPAENAHPQSGPHPLDDVPNLGGKGREETAGGGTAAEGDWTVSLLCQVVEEEEKEKGASRGARRCEIRTFPLEPD